jgi:hypothetical protein
MMMIILKQLTNTSVTFHNVVRYWYNLNGNAAGLLISDAVKAVDKARCTDKCTVALCGFVPTFSPTGIYICVHIYIYTFICVHIYLYIIYMYAYMYAYVCI